MRPVIRFKITREVIQETVDGKDADVVAKTFVEDEEEPEALLKTWLNRG